MSVRTWPEFIGFLEREEGCEVDVLRDVVSPDGEPDQIQFLVVKRGGETFTCSTQNYDNEQPVDELIVQSMYARLGLSNRTP